MAIKITYTQQGDYLLPDLKLPEEVIFMSKKYRHIIHLLLQLSAYSAQNKIDADGIPTPVCCLKLNILPPGDLFVLSVQFGAVQNRKGYVFCQIGMEIVYKLYLCQEIMG